MKTIASDQKRLLKWCRKTSQICTKLHNRSCNLHIGFVMKPRQDWSCLSWLWSLFFFMQLSDIAWKFQEKNKGWSVWQHAVGSVKKTFSICLCISIFLVLLVYFFTCFCSDHRSRVTDTMAFSPFFISIWTLIPLSRSQQYLVSSCFHLWPA